MTLERLLNSVGKRTFVKYYYNFKNKSRDYCITHFEEPFTDKGKSSKTGHAKAIFKSGQEKEALLIISTSDKVDTNAILLAKSILRTDF